MSTSRCRLMLLVVLSAALLSNCFTIGGPARSYAMVAAARAAKIPRSIRAPFTNTQMMTARGFGKRSGSSPGKFKELDSPQWSFNKAADGKFYNDLGAEGNTLDELLGDSSAESFPIGWLANEIAQNPIVVQAILRRFVDANHDDVITTHELLPQQHQQEQEQQQQRSPLAADAADMY